MERIFRRGLAAFRWGAWVWLAAVIAVNWNSDYLKHPNVAVVLVGLALLFTIVDTVLESRGVEGRTRVLWATGELTVGLLMMTLDGFVRRNGVIWETAPTLGSWWPVIGLLAFATYVPRTIAFLAGVLFGAARTVSVILNGIDLDSLTASHTLSLVNTGFFAGLAALTANGLVRLLRTAESAVALARAREEVSRALHDGVLQTLALVERRSGDPEIVSIVREQEREVRELLNERRASIEETDLRSGLAAVLSSFERHHHGTGRVVIAPDLPDVSKDAVAAIVGAAREAMNNAAKHGQADELTIYVEPHDESGVVCSINDNGKGFVVGEEKAGFGTANSIRGRIESIGGTVNIKSREGQGTEVELWVP